MVSANSFDNLTRISRTLSRVRDCPGNSATINGRKDLQINQRRRMQQAKIILQYIHPGFAELEGSISNKWEREQNNAWCENFPLCWDIGLECHNSRQERVESV